METIRIFQYPIDVIPQLNFPKATFFDQIDLFIEGLKNPVFGHIFRFLFVPFLKSLISLSLHKQKFSKIFTFNWLTDNFLLSACLPKRVMNTLIFANEIANFIENQDSRESTQKNFALFTSCDEHFSFLLHSLLTYQIY